jgi:hypothetical protein
MTRPIVTARMETTSPNHGPRGVNDTIQQNNVRQTANNQLKGGSIYVNRLPGGSNDNTNTDQNNVYKNIATAQNQNNTWKVNDSAARQNGGLKKRRSQSRKHKKLRKSRKSRKSKRRY